MDPSPPVLDRLDGDQDHDNKVSDRDGASPKEAHGSRQVRLLQCQDPVVEQGPDQTEESREDHHCRPTKAHDLQLNEQEPGWRSRDQVANPKGCSGGFEGLFSNDDVGSKDERVLEPIVKEHDRQRKMDHGPIGVLGQNQFPSHFRSVQVMHRSRGNPKTGTDQRVDGAGGQHAVFLNRGRREDVNGTQRLGAVTCLGVVYGKDTLARRHWHGVKEANEIGRECKRH